MRILVIGHDANVLPYVPEFLGGLDEDIFIREVDAGDVREVRWRPDTELVVVPRAKWSTEDTDLCRLLRAADPALPIVAVSGGGPARERAEVLLAGADESVAVPFDVEELAARIHALLRRAAAGGRRVCAGPFAVDVSRRVIAIDGVVLTLTLRQYDVLARLVEHAGSVVTRRELSRSDGELESNSVDVHMSRIRDKLGVHSSRIETVRGVGYRLRAV